jgi:hypothetical protein
LEHCVEVLGAQRAQAIESLKERASNYAVPMLPSCTGSTILKASASGLDLTEAVNEDCQPGLERFIEAIENTYGDAEEEMRAIVAVVPGSDVKRLYSEFWRRRAFWTDQLEETWSAWERATRSMHQTSESALHVWTDIMSTLPMYLSSKADFSGLSPVLACGLADVAAAGLDMELWEIQCSRCPSALDSNGSLDKTGESNECWTDPPSSGEHKSRVLIISILEVLGKDSALHMVGQALAGKATTTHRMPAGHLAVAIAVARSGDADMVFEWLNRTGPRGQWVVWLVDCLIEAMCEAANCGDTSTIQEVLRLCESLGGKHFANAVCSAGSRASTRTGMTPLQLATAGEHSSAVEVLHSNTFLEPLKQALYADIVPTKGPGEEDGASNLASGNICIPDMSSDIDSANSDEVAVKKMTDLSPTEKSDLWSNMLKSVLPSW